MYWSDSTWTGPTPRMQRANLDGSVVETILSGGFPWGVSFGAGPTVALIKAVKPSFSYLSVGNNYQLQISSALNTWTNYGTAFTATNSNITYPQYWDVDSWNQLFFRLQVVP